MELHKRGRDEAPVLGLEEAADRLAHGDDERAHVEDADDTPREAPPRPGLGLQLRPRDLGGHPAARRVGDEEHVLPPLHQRPQDLEHGLGVLLALRVTPRGRGPVKVGAAHVADAQLGEVGGGELGAVRVDAPGPEGLEEGRVWRRGVVRAVAEHDGQVGRRRGHVCARVRALG